jgi:very-short-patch-repair endonuclease
MTKLFNTKETKKIRRELRKQPISAERVLWSRLRKKQLGCRFNRQYGIGKFVVDFYCAEKKIVVEIDGATHGTEAEIRHDLKREKFLKNLGLNIKRYTNRNVFDDLDLVVGDIYEILNPPQPSL